MKFLHHNSTFGIGDNLAIPSFCNLYPSARVVFCISKKYAEDFSKITFVVNDKPIKHELFDETQLEQYHKLIKKDSINIGYVPESAYSFRNRYDVELPEQNIPDLPDRFTLMHYNSYMDYGWALNTGRYIFDHIWNLIMADKTLMGHLKPIINISPERKSIDNEYIKTKKLSLIEILTLVRKCNKFIGTASGPSVLAHMLRKKVSVSWIDHTLFDRQFSSWYLHNRNIYYPFDNIGFFHPQSQKTKDIISAIKNRFIPKI